MNEEQKRREMQIEEMAQIICGRSKDDICLIDKTSCDSSCRWARNAEAIYNAGYRKLPEDSIVLSREESQALKKQIEYWEYETKVAREEIDNAGKETAKEILNELIDSSNKITFFDCKMALGLDKLAKQFGLEVEE